MTLPELYNKICKQYEDLEKCNLAGEEFQRMLDISMELNKKSELLMSIIAFTYKSIDKAEVLDQNFKIDISSLPFFDTCKQADTKPLLANGRKQLVDISKGRKNE